jgi:hypothetical protein
MKHISQISKTTPVVASKGTVLKPCNAIKEALDKECITS